MILRVSSPSIPLPPSCRRHSQPPHLVHGQDRGDCITVLLHAAAQKARRVSRILPLSCYYNVLLGPTGVVGNGHHACRGSEKAWMWFYCRQNDGRSVLCVGGVREHGNCVLGHDLCYRLWSELPPHCAPAQSPRLILDCLSSNATTPRAGMPLGCNMHQQL